MIILLLLPFFLLLLQRMAHSIPLPLSKLNSHLAPFENGCLVTFEVIPDLFVANALSKLKLTKTASVSSLNECAFVCYQNFCSAAIFEFAQPISRCHLQIGPGEICNRRLQRHYSFRNQQRAIISCIRCSPSKPVTISREAELPLGATTLAPSILPIFRPLSPRPSLLISPSSSTTSASPPASNPLTASPQNATLLANAGEGEKKEKNIEKGKKKEELERKEEGKKKKIKEEENGKKEGKEKEIKEEMKEEEGRKSDEKQVEKEEEEQFAKRNLQKLTVDLLKQEGEKWRISTEKNGTEEENGEKKKKKIEGKLGEEEKPKKLFNTVFSIDLLAEENSKKGWKIGAKAKKEEAQNETKNELGETKTKEMEEEEELRKKKDGKKDEEGRGRTEEPIEVVTFEEAEKGTEMTTMGKLEGKNLTEEKKEEEGKEKEENLGKRNLKVISLEIGKEGELTTTPEGIEKMETTLGGEKRKEEEGENSAEIIAKIEKKIKTKDLGKKEEKSKEIFSMAFDGKEEEINRKKKHREEGEKIEGGGELEGKKEGEKEATPCDEKKKEKKEKEENKKEEEEQLAKRNLKAQTLDELKGNAEKLRESKLNKKEEKEEKGHLKGKIEEENGKEEENTSEVKKNEGKDEGENGGDKKVEKKEGEGKEGEKKEEEMKEEKGERKEEKKKEEMKEERKEEEKNGKKEEERKEEEEDNGKKKEDEEGEKKEEKSEKEGSKEKELGKKEEEVASTIAAELGINQTVQTLIILELTTADDSESTLRELTTSSSVGLEEMSTESTTKEEGREEKTTSKGEEGKSTEKEEKSTEKPQKKEKENLKDEEDGIEKKKGGEGEEDGIEKKSGKEGKKKRNEKSLDSKELKDNEEEWAKEHGFVSDEGREEVPKSDEKKEDEKKGEERKKGKGGIGMEGSEGEREEEKESGEEKIRPRRSRANAAKTLNETAVPLVERSIDSLAPAKGIEPPETHPSPPTIRLENGCFITFQAESLANRPTQFKAPFELSLEVESIEICAVRCYQDGCTGALYHSHNKTCILGYEDKHFCSAGPIISRFRHLAQLKGVNPIWIHCVNCRPEVNRLTGDLERIEGSKRGQRPIQAQPTSTQPPAPQSPPSTSILPILKSSTSISAINRQQSISSQSVAPSTVQIPALSTTTLAKIILPSSTPIPPSSISPTNSPVSTKASNDLPKNVDQSTPLSTPSPTMSPISPISPISSIPPIHSTSPSTPIVPSSIAPIQIPSGSNIPGTIKLDHGCFITFQAEPLAKRPSNHKAPFELKLDVESIEVCAIRCYQDGCTGALFHSKSRICELSYDDKHFCSNAPIISKFAHLAELRAVDPLWIHCVNCRPEVNRKTGQLENKKRE